MEFVRDSQCSRCPLAEGVSTVCVPTVPLLGPPRKERAVLIVGEAPGFNEDRDGRPFVGKAGRMLRQVYIEFFKLPEKVDVYLTNAVRCRPPGNKTPNLTQMKSCQGFLLADVIRLQREYKEVVILAVGAPAVKSVLGPKASLRWAFGRQGRPSRFESLINKQKKFHQFVEEYPKPCPVFATYHPAFVDREPSNALTVKRHVEMLVDYLDGNYKPGVAQEEALDIQTAPNPPDYPVSRLCLDIETYGFMTQLPSQTQFHPVRSERVDGVPPSAMIATCSLTWKNEEGGLEHGAFVMSEPQHRRKLWGWLRKCQNDPEFEFLVGQNISFDLLYLRHCYPECRTWLNHDLPIWDTIISNYLHDEGRPEKSLKSLAPLFRITQYKDDTAFVRYSSAWDPRLWAYNCQDTRATLLLEEKLEEEIRSLYGRNTEKLSPFCRRWYSNLLWLIVWMQEAGTRMDQLALQELHDRYVRRMELIKRIAKERWDIPVRGTGSEKAKRDIMNEAVSGLDKVPELVTTPAKGLISFNTENRNALLNVLPQDLEVSRKLRLLGRYQDTAKLLDSYTYPLLVGRGKKHDNPDTKLWDGIAYSKIFPVPSEWADGSTGGTKQARLAVSGPSVPTFPPLVKKRITSRYDYLIWFDYSQIELRVAALLSDDPEMMRAYIEGLDFHGSAAKIIFLDYIAKMDRSCGPYCRCIHCKYRQAGKTYNFRMIYRGGAQKAQDTFMKDLGLHVPLDEIVAADARFWAKHPRLREWQDGLMAFVRKHGYYELPLIGQSRLYMGGRRAQAKKMNEIVNQPVQTVAANIMLSAQHELWRRIKEAKLRALCPVNVYDASAVEASRYDKDPVLALMDEVLPNPPYYQALCDHLGRSLPLVFEAEVKDVRKL